MLLPTLIDLRRPEGKPLDPEDIFGSSLGGVFTDDLQNQHGDDPDTTIVYKNLRLGDVEFRAAEVDGGPGSDTGAGPDGPTGPARVG